MTPIFPFVTDSEPLSLKALDIGAKCELRHFWRPDAVSANGLDVEEMPETCGLTLEGNAERA